jgi:hypothetical protein
MSAESQRTLMGNIMTGTSPRQRWLHETIEELLEVVFSTRSDTRQQRNNGTCHTTPRRQERNCCMRCFLWGPPWGFIRRASCGLEWVQSWVIAVSCVGVSESVERWQLVSSTQEPTTEGKCQLKPASRGQRELVASLRGCKLGSRGTSAKSCCQATLVKTVKSLV